ncbi:MAG: shikimate kinase [Paracoccaceae bacterium]
MFWAWFRKDKEMKLTKPIILVGMMGSGKTAVGRELAHMLQVEFIDSDAEIEKAANMSIPEIFSRDGEAFFRKRETEVLRRIILGESKVMATGGGAFIGQINRKMILSFGVSVWLNADIGVLWERVKNKKSRPLIMTEDPFSTLKGLHDEREQVYKQADISIEIKFKISVIEAAELVLERLIFKGFLERRKND